MDKLMIKEKLKNVYNGKNRYVNIAVLAVYDMLAVYLSQWLALITRFDFRISGISAEYIAMMEQYTAINIISCLAIFCCMGLYNRLWRYASVRELLGMVYACTLTAVCQVVGTYMLNLHMPRSYYIIFYFFLLLFTGISRFAYRGTKVIQNNLQGKHQEKIRTMIVGAGDAGSFLIREIMASDKIANQVVCVIDDDKTKIGHKIFGTTIVGNHSQIPEMAEKYRVEEIFIAIPSLSGKRRKEIYEICKETGCRMKTLPSTAQIINNEVKVSTLRNVELEDLLGREPVRTNLEEVMEYITGKTVLVTGGGGSIGSELCRQIAGHQPGCLIIFDIYENTTYDIQLELRRKYPELNMAVLIGSVRNTHRVNSIFEKYHPDIVFHAAAHKHVPLMEDSPNEAIKNNVFGTYNVAWAAAAYKAKNMVLISTDKAVNPTNIMGASKRICEMIIQEMARQNPGTNYAAVRFGNVLGSNGSVIPLFKKQIAQGGPVTVTDKNIIRYFMTIPEAVSLVLQAGAYAKGGEIFVLDMGEPVRIDDMARNLIKLSGLEPDVDIKIVYTGLRPGEKLFEECLKEEEGLRKTQNNLIFIGEPIEFDGQRFFELLTELKTKAYEDREDMKEIVSRMVPSYQYRKQEEENKNEQSA